MSIIFLLNPQLLDLSADKLEPNELNQKELNQLATGRLETSVGNRLRCEERRQTQEGGREGDILLWWLYPDCCVVLYQRAAVTLIMSHWARLKAELIDWVVGRASERERDSAERPSGR